MKKFLISIFINVGIVGNIFSTSSLYNLDNLNNQLSNSAILCMYQDSYGFMWFGTYDGLNLYDGKDVTTFRFESNNTYSLSGNSIHKIIQADRDHLWISTHVGLDKFSLKERRVVESYTSYEKIELMAVNNNNEAWLINKDNYISYYNNSQNKFLDIPVKGLNINDVRSIFVDEKNQLCLINKKGKLQLITFKESNKQENIPYELTIKEEVFHNRTINNVFYEDRRIYFIDEKNDLYVFDKANQQKLYLRNITDIINQYGSFISSLCVFKNDIFIAFLHGGLIKMDMSNDTHWMPINTSIGIFSLLKDHYQDAIWVATDGRGVELYYNEKNTFGNILFDNLPFVARRPVRAIYTDENNTLWIGSKGDGIIKIKDYHKFNNKQIPKANAENLAQDIQFRDPVYCFVRSKYNKNDLWIVGDKFSYYSYKDNKIYNIAKPNEQTKDLSDIHALCEVNDSTIWMSSFGLWEIVLDKTTTPYKIKKQKKQNFQKNGNYIDDIFFSMLYDGNSILSLGNRKGYGVIQYNIHNAEYKYVSVGKADNKGLGDVICLYSKGDSILYIGSSSGLTVVEMSGGKENRVKQFGRKDGIINDMIHGILEDNTGIIWLSTSNGLVKYNPNNDSFFNVKSSKIGVSEFSDDAYWRCPSSGRLFFGGVNGLTWVEPSVGQNDAEYEPDLFFSELNLYGKVQTLYEYNEDRTKKIILPIDQNTFRISFIVLDYINGDNYDYSYMLEGYDTDWISLQKENKISFTKLPSGEYTLKVKYKNDVVNADNKIYSIPIVILPPWYLSRIAYIIYALLLLLCLISIYYYIRWRFWRKQEIMAKQIKREEQEKLYESKMKFFTNVTHELFTPLTLINGALDQIKESDHPDKINKYTTVLQNNVSNLSELIQEILDYRRIEEGHMAGLVLETISVTELMNRLLDSYSAMVKQNNVDLQVSIPQNLDWYTNKSSLKKIISNLLSNAFKYTPEGGIIKVDISTIADTLIITTYNTGKGIEKEKIKSIFNRFQILEDTDVNANNQMTARNGLGLSICYSMTKSLNGNLTVRSEVNKYTEFVVELPMLTKQETDPDPESADIKKRNNNIKEDIAAVPRRTIVVQETKSGSHILVVDDNKEIVELLSDILSDKYTVSKAYSVAEAQQVLKDSPATLIITDIMMPEVDGFTFIQMLYIFSIKFTDCLDFDLSVLIKTSIFINYQNIRYHE